MIKITHTRTGGTLVTGSTKGDGVYEILHGLHGHWRSSRSLGCLLLLNTRDRAAKTWMINGAAEALRKAGYEVTVGIDDTVRRDVAEVEADRADRAAARIERREGYAASASASADAAYAQYRQTADNWPAGQPLVSDSARRAHGRMMGAHERASREWDRAEHHAGRAAVAEANQAHRESIPATLRRIERLEAEERQIQRRLDGSGLALHGEDEPATGAYRERLSAQAADVAGQLAYWRGHVAQAEAAGVKIWGPADFSKGDYVQSGRRWYAVERVNPKSLSVPHGNNDHLLPVVTRAEVRHAMGPSQWTRKITYDDVTGRKSAAEIAAMLAGPRAQGPAAAGQLELFASPERS